MESINSAFETSSEATAWRAGLKRKRMLIAFLHQIILIQLPVDMPQ